MTKKSFKLAGMTNGKRGFKAEGAFLAIVFGVVALIFELAGKTELRWLWIGVIFGIIIMIGASFASDVREEEKKVLAREIKEEGEEEKQ